MKMILLVLLAFVSLFSSAQESFKWDIVKESPKTKEQLYSDTKMFIAEAWNSAQSVIQNDDKENGLILVKGISSQTMKIQLVFPTWTFAYTVKFYMKDHKYRIVIDNVNCESANCGVHQWPLMPVADNYPEEKGGRTTGLNKKRYESLMSDLKQELQTLVDSYQTYMENINNTDHDW